MYQINYKGLKKRDSYDEIVALLRAGEEKINILTDMQRNYLILHT